MGKQRRWKIQQRMSDAGATAEAALDGVAGIGWLRSPTAELLIRHSDRYVALSREEATEPWSARTQFTVKQELLQSDNALPGCTRVQAVGARPILFSISLLPSALAPCPTVTSEHHARPPCSAALLDCLAIRICLTGPKQTLHAASSLLCLLALSPFSRDGFRIETHTRVRSSL